MPELPEVQCIINTLEKDITNKKIIKVTINNFKLREYINSDIEKLIKNNIILRIERKGKYIIFHLKKGFIVIHLGMTGKLVNSKLKEKHEHILLELENGIILKYIDPRKFGFFIYEENLSENKYLRKLGLDPFDNKVNSCFLYNKIKKSKKSIKALLLDQSIISGIGNIYASEILFISGISPLKQGKDITIEESEKIIINTKKILKDSIKKGGSTISDYRNGNNEAGNFQNSFKVYGKKECINCSSKIISIKQNSRTTFYCDKCQS